MGGVVLGGATLCSWDTGAQEQWPGQYVRYIAPARVLWGRVLRMAEAEQHSVWAAHCALWMGSVAALFCSF